MARNSDHLYPEDRDTFPRWGEPPLRRFPVVLSERHNRRVISYISDASNVGYLQTHVKHERNI